MSPRFSIIVPVYNAQRYLHDCLESIKSQTCQDFEVITVDDGSTDGTIHILDIIKSEDNRFQIFHQEHRGVSSARNVGINKAAGDFICFVDADDQIAPTYLSDLYQAIGEADSSMCGFKKTDLLSHEDCEIVPQNKIETLEENLAEFYNAGPTDWQRYLWNRMFKKSVIDQHNLRFIEDIYYKEDGLFVVQYLCASNGLVGCVDKVLYYYRRNSTGAMSKTWHSFDKKIITNLTAHKLIINEIRHKGVSQIVLTKAINQAKASCNWILQMMFKTKSIRMILLIRIERIMVSILGLQDYLSWRVSQVVRFYK
ncbi:MAG: glycosyltransferase [Bacteroidales bacterium]|nr:glycosyltransferase [Bacteroidales bacterium]